MLTTWNNASATSRVCNKVCAAFCVHCSHRECVLTLRFLSVWSPLPVAHRSCCTHKGIPRRSSGPDTAATHAVTAAAAARAEPNASTAVIHYGGLSIMCVFSRSLPLSCCVSRDLSRVCLFCVVRFPKVVSRSDLHLFWLRACSGARCCRRNATSTHNRAQYRRTQHTVRYQPHRPQQQRQPGPQPQLAAVGQHGRCAQYTASPAGVPLAPLLLLLLSTGTTTPPDPAAQRTHTGTVAASLPLRGQGRRSRQLQCGRMPAAAPITPCCCHRR